MKAFLVWLVFTLLTLYQVGKEGASDEAQTTVLLVMIIFGFIIWLLTLDRDKTSR